MLRAIKIIVFLCFLTFLWGPSNALAEYFFIRIDGQHYGIDRKTLGSGENAYSYFYSLPLLVYDNQQNPIPPGDMSDELKKKILATVEALDHINNINTSQIELLLELSQTAGNYAYNDVIETVLVDATGFISPIGYLEGLPTTPVSLIVDTAVEGFSLNRALSTAKDSQKLHAAYYRSIKNEFDLELDDRVIDYITVRNIYYTARLYDIYGETVEALYRLTIDSATINEENVAEDLFQAQTGFYGAIWSAFEEGREAADLYWEFVFAFYDVIPAAIDEAMDNIYTNPDFFFGSQLDFAFTEHSNTAPVANITLAANEIDVGQSVSFNANASTDADGDSLTYNWHLAGPQGNLAVPNNPSANQTYFIPQVAGTYYLTVTVSDSITSSTETKFITVSPTVVVPNNAPIALITASALSTPVQTQITLSASSSYDPEGSSLTAYQWELIPPNGSSVTLSAASGETVTFTPTTAGSYSAILTVSDGNQTGINQLILKATETYPTIEEDIEDDGDRHVYIWDLDVDDCQFKSVGSWTVPAGEQWKYLKIAGSREDIVLVARWNEVPRPMDSNWKSMCESGYNINNRFVGTELNFINGTDIKRLETEGYYHGEGEVLYMYAYSPDAQEGGGVSNYSVNTIVRVTYDLDDDGVPDFEEDAACLNDSTDSFDSDGDNICNNADKFDNDPAASVDSDNDGYPDSWNSGYSQALSTTGLVLDHPSFVNNPAEWADTDNDGIGNNTDQLDTDPAASVDTDGDGYPDSWNAGKTQSDSTTGLYLDDFVSDPAASKDTDGDLHPDFWNPEKGTDDSTTGLTLDAFPDDISEWHNSDDDTVGDNADWAPNDSSEWVNSDGDPLGDNADVAPLDPSRWLNSPPEFESIDNQNIRVGSTRQFPLAVVDADSDIITLSFISAPESLSLVGNQLHFSPGFADVGEHRVIIEAADPYKGYSYQDFTLVVSESCSYTMSAPSHTISSGGGTGSFQLTTMEDCSWSITENADWIELTSASNGTGNVTVSYTVDPNLVEAPRTAVIVVAGQDFTINQEALPPCTYTTNRSSYEFTTTGGTRTITIETQSRCEWSVTKDVPWIVFEGETTGTGNGSIQFNVGPNSSEDVLNGVLTAAGQKIQVRQLGQLPCEFLVNPKNWHFLNTGGSAEITVETRAGCEWIATENSDWLSISGQWKVNNSGTLHYTVEPNDTTEDRSAIITIANQEHVVHQHAGREIITCAYDVTVDDLVFSKDGGAGKVNIETSPGCPWTVTTGADWVYITANQADVQTGYSVFHVDPNDGGARNTTITVMDKTFTIKQEGVEKQEGGEEQPEEEPEVKNAPLFLMGILPLIISDQK